MDHRQHHSTSSSSPTTIIYQFKSFCDHFLKWKNLRVLVLSIIGTTFALLVLISVTDPRRFVIHSPRGLLEYSTTSAPAPSPAQVVENIATRFQSAKQLWLTGGAAVVLKNGSPLSTQLMGDIWSNAHDTPVAFSPFPNWYNVPIMDPLSKTLFCWIPKNACSQFKALMCRRNEPFNATLDEGIQMLKDNAVHNWCKYWFYHFFLLREVFNPKANRTKLPKKFRSEHLPWPKDRREVYLDPKWAKWAVLRDPFDRLLSGWSNKCGPKVHPKIRAIRCYGCASDFECFVSQNLRFLSDFSRIDKFNPNGTFRNFTLYDHFYPQYWSCDFKHHLNAYQFFYYDKSESFKNEIRQSFLDRNWPKELLLSGWGPNKTYGFMDTFTQNRQPENEKKFARLLLRTRVDLADLVFRAYFMDFMMLNFPVPSWTIELCAGVENAKSKYSLCRWVL